MSARPEPFDPPLILSRSKDERLAQDRPVDQPPRFALRRSAVALAKAEGRVWRVLCVLPGLCLFATPAGALKSDVLRP